MVMMHIRIKNYLLGKTGDLNDMVDEIYECLYGRKATEEEFLAVYINMKECDECDAWTDSDYELCDKCYEEKISNTTVYEWCPQCTSETEIGKSGGPCKECGRFLLPCSMCNLDVSSCKNCELEKGE